ncbi:hypothetical protein DXT99_17940 [Pontibacter diazotrophicus]|uniref:Uncharacterized protein n=1 Tax=Pontibacter diazotrophicus TaxID=1400979 RepID=A0A3D8L8N2_9BACT|nr:hypothetical protein DXT99_17940 [Pontibacter diazotrophicus]
MCFEGKWLRSFLKKFPVISGLRNDRSTAHNLFNYYNQQIQPATGGELNVLEEPEYAGLRKLLNRLH